MRKISYGRWVKFYLYSRRIWLVSQLIFFLFLSAMASVFETAHDVLVYLSFILLVLAVFAVLIDGGLNLRAYQDYLYREREQPSSPLEAELFQKVKQLEDLQKADKESERKRSADLKDYFTLWAHQIKTPIAASRLLIADLEKGKLSSQLEQENFKIDAYANAALHYLRLESFHEDLTIEQLNLEDLVRQAVKKYAVFFIHKGISLDMHDLDEVIVTDKKWFSLMLEQILSNSLKYTSQGKIDIFVSEEVLHIRDTGIGIQVADQGRVFERGFSGYNGRLTQQSSGLGLYLTKQVADKLGHRLDLKSQVGQGTTLKIGIKRKSLLLD